MEEEFLHYLWKFRLLNLELKSTAGDEVVVLHPGDHNTNSGPDFLNARIRIGGTVWAGNVEIHCLSTDWFRHRHHLDRIYDSVILHVVHRFDPAMDPLNITTLELDGQFPDGIRERYEMLMQNRQWIPCGQSLDPSYQTDLSLWLPSLTAERLGKRCEEIRLMWESCGKDWEECFYRYFASCFGFRINSLPFELLAGSLPLKFLQKNTASITRLEALLFGHAGMLERDHKDPYPALLRHEYRFLAEKYGLSPAMDIPWRFLRLRPSNFPTIRISQFASLIQATGGRLYRLLEEPDVVKFLELLMMTASPYWDDHFMFDRYSPRRMKIMGDHSKLLLMINGIVPFLFFVGMEKKEDCWRDRAFTLLESLPGEMNPDIRKWKEAGMETGDAMKTQGLLQLKRSYCDRKRCLECRIGLRVLCK
jgi:hypothetical protein